MWVGFCVDCLTFTYMYGVWFGKHQLYVHLIH